MSRRALWAVGLLLWGLGVGVGLTRLWSYENEPAAPATIAQHWPDETAVRQRPGRPTLLVMLHPQCSCSRATVAELARLMARNDGRLDAYVLVLAPASEPDAWIKSDLWRAAAAIPGVRVIADADGADARRFGAVASGQTMLYGGDGRLEFSGGITASRGHEGDNAGVDAIDATLQGGHAPHPTSTFVFGCLLFNADGGPGLADFPADENTHGDAHGASH